MPFSLFSRAQLVPSRRLLYSAAGFKRVQCLGGAKNFMIVMPDSVMEKTGEAIIGSAFGAAGERCLAGSVILAVGDAYEPLRETLVRLASRVKVGCGLDESVQMGPVVSKRHMDRVVGYID